MAKHRCGNCNRLGHNSRTCEYRGSSKSSKPRTAKSIKRSKPAATKLSKSNKSGPPLKISGPIAPTKETFKKIKKIKLPHYGTDYLPIAYVVVDGEFLPALFLKNDRFRRVNYTSGKPKVIGPLLVSYNLFNLAEKARSYL